MQRPQTKPKTVKKLGDELKELRRRYANVIEGLRRHLKRSGGDSEIPEFLVASEYAELVHDFETGHHPHSSRSVVLQFRDAVFSIPDLLSRIEEDLVLRSVKSDQDRKSLEAFNKLPFVKNLDNCLRNAPFRTLNGLDAVIALLSRKRGGTAALKRLPRYRTGSSPARVDADASSGKDAEFDSSKLRAARKKHNFTQEDAAGWFGITERQYKRWEGTQKRMRLEHFRCLMIFVQHADRGEQLPTRCPPRDTQMSPLSDTKKS